MASCATPEEITETVERREQCKETWSLDIFIASLQELYELLITMGHWPEKGVEKPPSEGWSEADFNASEALRLGYTEKAIEALKRLPYPAEELRHGEEEIDILGGAQLFDYRDIGDLKAGRFPCGSPNNPNDEVDGFIVPILNYRNRDGMSVLLNVNDGIIYEWNFMDPLQPRCVEYRVQQHFDGLEELGDDFPALGERIHPRYYKYQPFTPAVDYIRNLYQRFRALSLLPLITPRWDADRGIDFSRIEDEWRRDFLRRRQGSVAALYEKHLWPDLGAFDREGVAAAWKVASKEFDVEATRHFDEERRKLRQAGQRHGYDSSEGERLTSREALQLGK